MQPKEPRSILKTIAITLGVLLAISTIAYGAYFAKINIFSCTYPVKYSIGDVDSRFKISSSEVEAVSKDAASRWNKAENKNFLNYNSASVFKINLIYDQRQADLDKLNSQLDQLKISKSTLDSQNKKFNDFLSQYQSQLNSYNAEVQKWNSQGGAPSHVFQSLEAQKKSLENMQTTLKQMADVFNIDANSFNNDLQGLNQVVDQKKNEIVTKGEYMPSVSTINIYTFGNKEELRLVLMHELGHAMGIDHVQNEQAIMHDILDLINLDNPTATADDLSALNSHCKANLNYNSSRYFGYMNRFFSGLN